MKRRLRTVAQVAEDRGVSPRTVRSWLERMTARDRARCVEQGRPKAALLIREGELDGWLAVRREGGTRVITVIEDSWLL